MSKAISIRGVDERIFRRFRAKTIEKRMRAGEALTMAMMNWLQDENRKRLNPANLLKLKPFDWGKHTEKTSKEIDKILYGSKR